MFMIRNADGLFSTGGTSPNFKPKGKMWKMRGHVSGHLAQFKNNDLVHYYAGCEVVEFELTETGNTVSVDDWSVTPATARAKELAANRQSEYELTYLEQQRQLLQDKLNQLNQKLQNNT